MVLPVVLQTFSNVRTAPEFLVQLEQFGLLDAVLPFILIFAVIFTVTSRTQVLGNKKNVHMLVALVISLLVVIPHVMGTYPPGQDVVNIINNALPNISLVIVIIVAALILMGIFLPQATGVPMGGLLAFLSVGVVVYIFGISAGWWQAGGGPFGFLSNPDVQALVVIILVFAVVIFLITAESPMDRIGGFVRSLTGGGH
ncbi:hypothetical protein HYU20_01370 [Candidatus Woesearchaeota archaeon]|nr:hypothetical protein [Candidatus Woesearchaeota archaeon]